jgi:hypothetical protein
MFKLWDTTKLLNHLSEMLDRKLYTLYYNYNSKILMVNLSSGFFGEIKMILYRAELNNLKTI